jgi:hypothetical protein
VLGRRTWHVSQYLLPRPGTVLETRMRAPAASGILTALVAVACRNGGI